MYHLAIPSSLANLPLLEHTGLRLVSALMCDERDDRCDVLSGVLRSDPMLCCWVACAADSLHQQRIDRLGLAADWLSQHLVTSCTKLGLLGESSWDSAARLAWRELVAEAVACGRTAGQLARTIPTAGATAQPTDAEWLAMLLSVRQQLQGLPDGQADRKSRANPGVATKAMRDQSPLGSCRPTWPQWLDTIGECPPDSGSERGAAHEAAAAALDQLRARPEHVQELVSQEELATWFQAHPDLHGMLPRALARQARYERLDVEFEATLLHEKLASLQQFAYGASHEINNPLANISTRAQTLLYNEHDPQRRQKLQAINQQAFRAYEMIADLMLFAKPPKLNSETLSWCEILPQVREELLSASDNTQLQIQLEWPADAALTMVGDRTQLSVALKAICQNAMEAMPHGGVVTVQASETHHDIAITIDDQGHGLNEQQRRHLFDPFYSGREAGRGLGFGLCKAWRIAQLHEGELGVQSQLGGGCRFTLHLPRGLKQSA